MRILVTGATGFIGNHLILELIKTDHHIIATGLEDKKLLSFPWLDNVEYIQYDLSKSCDEYYNYFGKPDSLIHLAWQGLPNYDKLYHFEENLFQSYSFIKSLVDQGTCNVTVLGTCFEYGMQNGVLHEELSSCPNTPYSIAKDTLRKFLESLALVKPFDLKWVRLFYLYGAGEKKNSIISQLQKALDNNEKVFNMSGGEQLRDYLPVQKVADYLAKIAVQTEVKGIINCCSGTPVSIRSLVENYIQEKGGEIKLNLGYYPYPTHEPMAFWGSNTKLKRIIERNHESEN